MQRCAGVCRTTRVLESDKGADAAYSVAAHVMPVSHCSWFRVHRVDSHAVLQMCLHLMHNGAYAGHVMVEYGRVNVMPEVMPLFFHASCRVRRISDEQPHSQDVTHRRRVAHGRNERLDIYKKSFAPLPTGRASKSPWNESPSNCVVSLQGAIA